MERSIRRGHMMTHFWPDATEERNSDSISTEDFSTEAWNKCWELGTTEWHEQDVNSSLLRHVDELVGGRQHIRIFVPLCGKTVDLKWLADKGHTVVGVECSQLALEAFFNEHSLEFTREPVNQLNGFLYKSTTLPISLYCCDIMEFPKAEEEHFDAVWDRGSLIAIKPTDIQQYIEVICSVMSDDCCYLLEVFDIDKDACTGPPQTLSDADMQELFGDKFVCRKLSAVNLDDEKKRKYAPQTQYFHVCSWLLTWK